MEKLVKKKKSGGKNVRVQLSFDYSGVGIFFFLKFFNSCDPVLQVWFFTKKKKKTMSEPAQADVFFFFF